MKLTFVYAQMEGSDFKVDAAFRSNLIPVVCTQVYSQRIVNRASRYNIKLWHQKESLSFETAFICELSLRGYHILMFYRSTDISYVYLIRNSPPIHSLN